MPDLLNALISCDYFLYNKIIGLWFWKMNVKVTWKCIEITTTFGKYFDVKIAVQKLLTRLTKHHNFTVFTQKNIIENQH